MSSGTANVTIRAGSGAGWIRNTVDGVYPGGGAYQLGKVEDQPHSNGDTGVMALGVRNDTRGTLAGTDLDYAPFQLNGSGDLRVDVSSINTSVTPGTSATRLGKAEDAPHGSGDTGVLSLVVRNDAGTALAGTDLDYIPPTTDSAGRLWVNASGAAVPISSVTTSVTPGTAATNLGKAEDAGHTSGDVGVMALAVRNDAGGTLAGTDLDYAPLQLDASGNVRVNIAAGSSSGVQYTEGDVDVSITGTAVMWEDAGNTLEPVSAARPLPTTTTVTAVTPGTGATNLGKAEDAPHTSGDVGVMGLAVRNDTRGSLAGTDLDYAPPQLNSSGDVRTERSSARDLIVTGTITALAGEVVLDVSNTGLSTAVLDVTGIWSGAIVVAGVTDAGTVKTLLIQEINAAGPIYYSGFTSNRTFLVNVAGWTQVKAYSSAWTSGTANIYWRATAGANAGLQTSGFNPGTQTANLGKAEDSGHTSSDTGVAVWTVRNDASSASYLAGSDGDYQALQSNIAGQLKVASTETHPSSTVTSVDLLGANDATRVLTLLAANTSRRGAIIANDTDATLLVKEGSAASPTSYTDVLPPGSRWVLDYPQSTSILTCYLPQIPSGQLLVTERQ